MRGLRPRREARFAYQAPTSKSETCRPDTIATSWTPAVERAPARGELGNHSGVGLARGGHPIDVVGREVRDRLTVGAEHTFCRAGNDQAARAKRGSQMSRQRIGIDVQEIAGGR